MEHVKDIYHEEYCLQILGGWNKSVPIAAVTALKILTPWANENTATSTLKLTLDGQLRKALSYFIDFTIQFNSKSL